MTREEYPLKSGTGRADVSPAKPMFLYGYPHVERTSTGINDPLYASALFLDNGCRRVCFCAVDVIFISKQLYKKVLERVAGETGLDSSTLILSATHTHSGPVTETMLSNKGDPVVPPVDGEYLSLLVKGICSAILQAYEAMTDSTWAITTCSANQLGGNRRDLNGPRDPEVPLLITRRVQDSKVSAILMVCNMHPTVLHEDSTLVSSDFPGYARKAIENDFPGALVVYHTGPAGNQSPRHVTKANTFAEAERLGAYLGSAASTAIRTTEEGSFQSCMPIYTRSTSLDLPAKSFPEVAVAEERLAAAVTRLEELRSKEDDPKATRTAECDWFGAEEVLTLSKAQANGELTKEYSKFLPAAVSVVTLGTYSFAAWPGEVFIEYLTELKERSSGKVWAIALANGTTGGYIVTEEADAEQGYEASNALLSWQAGQILVESTLEMIAQSDLQVLPRATG